MIDYIKACFKEAQEIQAANGKELKVSDMVLGFVILIAIVGFIVAWVICRFTIYEQPTTVEIFQIRDPIMTAICLFGIWWALGNVIHATILGCFGFGLEVFGFLGLFIAAPFIPVLWLVVPILMIFSHVIYDIIRFGFFYRQISYERFIDVEQHFCTKLIYLEGIKKAREARENSKFLEDHYEDFRWLRGHMPREYDGAMDITIESIDWEGIEADVRNDVSGNRALFMNQLFGLASERLAEDSFEKSFKPVFYAIAFYIGFCIITSFMGYVLTMGGKTTADHGLAYYCEKPVED